MQWVKQDYIIYGTVYIRAAMQIEIYYHLDRAEDI